jgi:hypothetical protein
MDRALIESFATGGQRLRHAVSGLTRDQLHWKPPAEAKIGLWSIHQIVIHMLDADLVGIDRMKRLAAEPNPLLVGYNESLFAQHLLYDEQSTEDALNLHDLSRQYFATILRKLPEQAFERTGIHTETGMVSLGQQVKKYEEHLEHHLAFIAKKRQKMSK